METIAIDDTMKATGIIVNPVSIDAMLEMSTRNYNPREWDKAVLRHAEFEKCQFYFAPRGGGFGHSKYWVSYIVDGIYLFKDFSPFAVCMHSGPFCKVVIWPDGMVYKILFESDGKKGYAEDCEENREVFKSALTPLGLMVSKDICKIF